MTAHELRKKYIEFFEQRGHVHIPSSSLVPENDPSVLFTTAGMHPLVPYLMGEKHPAGIRLVDYQKCVRTGDIDEVGDDTHLTFFEMLGNWSLGDYFKEDSIRWSFEFLTSQNWLGLPLEKLAVSVFEGDDVTGRDSVSARLWLELGISENRIADLGKEDNWWPAGGKHSGPQGPDTEIFYWAGEDPAPEVFDGTDERWVEIWNNVFMEFDKDGDVLTPLAQRNVDTGMGLERTAAVLQGKSSVYDTELFQPILNKIDQFAVVPNSKSRRIIADHIRAATFMLGDSAQIEPSNVDQGYIVRRLIRRAIRHGKMTGIEVPFTTAVAGVIVDQYAEAYPELRGAQSRIVSLLSLEEEKFSRTLDRGLKEFEKIASADSISAQDAFHLFSTYGFPLELTAELAAERGQEVDVEVFASEFVKHQKLSRAGAGKKFAGGLADNDPKTIMGHTATHLLHQALRTVLGDHVEQKGSNITAKRLRFDFVHAEKMTEQQRQRVEDIVNDQIAENLPVRFEMLTVDEAKTIGAIGLFEDTYAHMGDKVKVYFVGDGVAGYASKEICGGPHVSSTGEIGGFKITKEESSSQGVRRIKATVGN